MHICQCYARGGGQARCGDFCQMPLPRDNMSKCHTLKFCILSHFAFLFQKPLLLGNKLLKPNHYDQVEVKDFKGSEWDLHVPSYLKIEHGLPCNKVFCLFRFGLCSSGRVCFHCLKYTRIPPSTWILESMSTLSGELLNTFQKFSQAVI